MKTNNYTEGKKRILSEKRLTLKNIQTFEGRQGVGCSATIYFDNKKCGVFLDEARGGEYIIDWYHDSVSESACEYLQSLPKFSDIEWKKDMNAKIESFDSSQKGGWKWYWCDVIIEEHLKSKDYKRWLRKIVIFNKKTKEIEHYKGLKSDLDKKFKTDKGVESGREYFGRIGVILNDLPKKQAFEYFDKYKA